MTRDAHVELKPIATGRSVRAPASNSNIGIFTGAGKLANQYRPGMLRPSPMAAQT
jgi:hypothetical protein